MINVQLLDECIKEYDVLKKLEGLTEQQRGQKFNALFAKILNAHQIHAISDQRNIGEIDVCFRIKDKRFILEAKWEKSGVNMDPIAKLGLRINQRIPNNLGVLLSINGYTSEALQQMNGAGRPNILLLEQDIFLALLYANIDADVLFDACVDVAAFEGKMHIVLSDVLKYMPKKTLPFSVTSIINQEVGANILNQLNPKGDIEEYKIIKVSLPFGQNGISKSQDSFFVTLADGIYEVDTNNITKILEINNPQNRCFFDSDSRLIFFVINNSVLAVDKKGSFTPISKRYPGHVRLFRDNEKIHLFSNGDDFSPLRQPVKIVEDVAGIQNEMIFDYPISSCVDACFTGDNGCAIVGSSGLFFYQNMKLQWKIEVGNGASVSFLNERIYFLGNGTSLKSIDLDGKNVRTICEFNLQGSVGDFAIISKNEYIFHLCYREEDTTKTAVVYVKTTQ